MAFKDSWKKFWINFLNIITFGYIKRKAKRQAEALANQKNEQLTLNTVALPDVGALKNALGGESNVKEVKATISTITFEIVDMNQLNIDLLKKISIKGVIKSPTAVTLLIGDCAMELKKQFEAK